MYTRNDARFVAQQYLVNSFVLWTTPRIPMQSFVAVSVNTEQLR